MTAPQLDCTAHADRAFSHLEKHWHDQMAALAPGFILESDSGRLSSTARQKSPHQDLRWVSTPPAVGTAQGLHASAALEFHQPALDQTQERSTQLEQLYA